MPDKFMFTCMGRRFRNEIESIATLCCPNARQSFYANIASIAQSLRAIAQAIKEEQENKQEDKKDEHR